MLIPQSPAKLCFKPSTTLARSAAQQPRKLSHSLLPVGELVARIFTSIRPDFSTPHSLRSFTLNPPIILFVRCPTSLYQVPPHGSTPSCRPAYPVVRSTPSRQVFHLPLPGLFTCPFSSSHRPATQLAPLHSPGAPRAYLPCPTGRSCLCSVSRNTVQPFLFEPPHHSQSIPPG